MVMSERSVNLTTLFQAGLEQFTSTTVKTLKIGTPRLTTAVFLNIKCFNNAVMPPKDEDRMAYSVDPDQTAP